MMSGMPLETCWAFNKFWNNKFYYKVASYWLFLLIITAMHGYMNIKNTQIPLSACRVNLRFFYGSKKTAIISLYNINWKNFITEIVGSRSLYIIQANPIIRGHAVAYLVGALRSQVRFPMGSLEPYYGSGVVLASNRNEYQEYFLGGKGCGWIRMTTLPPSCTDCLEIW
jgi:hypothetical protein